MEEDEGVQEENTREAIRLANAWDKKTVTISGMGGSIGVTIKDVSTAHGRASLFQIERAPPQMNLPHMVAFRVVGTQRYLTNVMYGDRPRQDAAEALASVPSNIPILPDIIPTIIDYAIGRPTQDTNFEGSGFHYSPMTAEEQVQGTATGGGPAPNKFQLFQLEKVRDSHFFGVKSLFGTYWRSQHWVKKVSQSPHLLADETWQFTVQDTNQSRLGRAW
jgi:hypothetical protein|uniref:Uncharacterized protein n=1 Tax=Attheya septentrionalis TaxID=420275 RepID=A0A7S2XK46_9STRA|mmetsp:Transcript_15701/g.28565  ORF Transcript_15701/g.28565 Transcript_15701/m.28565 type:complete len:219 (+) Transcript_15701:60-716(+)|eukprot:CAMPEP_0198292092 /NCGR_PEP_ID=MMETSP1449-20131203/9869_1 /TAXON_ID=420275 /ORGANISM="Attheya septentrionalis, Strain CCMP2084" /LENGTH=218 /DNA_ID=CAMNT_0043990815 /DNA_START=51 /DNA_END=707 /DNA_ORIENTATION=+